MRVELAIDPRPGEQGAAAWDAAMRRVSTSTLAAARTLDELDRKMAALRGAQGISAPAAAQQATAAITAQAQATDRAAEASRRRASAVDAEARAMDRQIRAGITFLGTLGGEQRAFSQLTQARIREATAMGQQVDRASTLANVQRAVTAASQKANEVFSTGAVNARDLRVNMASLAGQATSLAANMTGLGGSLGRVVEHLRSMRAIATQATGLGAVGGGSVNPSEIASGGGAAGGAAAGAVAANGMRTALAALSPVAIAAGAAVAGVGIAAVSIVPSVVRASIEMDRIEGRLRAATGSSTAAKAEFKFVADESDRLGLNLQEAAAGYARVAAAAKGTNLEGQATRDIFKGIAEASAALRLSAAETGGVLYAVEQIISKGKLSSEELRRQLGDRLPGAFQLAATAMGVTTAELDEMLQQGLIPADEFLRRFSDTLTTRFGGEAAEAAKSLAGQIERLKSQVFQLLDAIGNTGIIDAFASAVGGMANALKAFNDARNAGSPLDEMKAETDRRIDQAKKLADAQKQIGPTSIGSVVNIADDERKRIGIKTDEEIAKIRKEANEAVLAVDKLKRAESDRAETLQKLNAAKAIGAISEADYQAGLKGAADAYERATKANDTHSKQIAKEQKAREQALVALDEYLEGLRQEVAFASLDEDSREVATARVEAYNKALEAGLPNARAIADEAERLVTAEQAITKAKESQKKADDDAKKLREDQRREAERAAEQQAELIRKPFENALTGVQEVFADAFRSIFGGAEENAKSFGQRLLDIMREVAAQVATLLVFRPILAGIGGAGQGGGGFLSSILGPLFGGGSGGGGTGAFGNVIGGASSTAPGGGIFSTLTSLFNSFGTKLAGSFSTLGTLFGGGGLAAAGGFSGVLGALGPLAALGGVSALGGSIGSSIVKALGREELGGVGGQILRYTGLLGPLIGSFFASRPDHQEFQVYSGGPVSPANIFEDGAFSESPFGRVGILGTKGTQVNQAFSQQLANFFGASDRAIAKSLTTDEVERVRLAIEDTLGVKVNTRGKNFSENDIAAVVQDRLARQFAALGLGQQLLGIEAQAAQASGNNPNATYLNALAGGAAKFLEERKTFLDALTELENPLKGAAQALKQVNDQFDALKEGAEAYGVDVARIEAARQQSLGRLRTEFDQGIQDAYLQLTNPAEAARLAEERAGQQRIEDAKALGADLNAVYQLNALLLQRTIEESLRAQFAGISEFLRALTATTASPLAPQTVLANAQAEYDKVIAKVRSGDEAALAQFPTVADALIGAAQAFYASGPQFAAIFQSIVDAAKQIESILGNQPGAIVPDLVGQNGRVTQPAYDPDLSGLGTVTSLGLSDPALASGARRAVKATATSQTDAILVSMVREQAKTTATLAEELRATRAELIAIRTELAKVSSRASLAEAAPTATMAEA